VGADERRVRVGVRVRVRVGGKVGFKGEEFPDTARNYFFPPKMFIFNGKK
jgi:hypothetical protein